jgi:hypothetical protein
MDRTRVAERQRCGRNFAGMSLTGNRPSSREFDRSITIKSLQIYAGKEYSDTQAVPISPAALIDRLLSASWAVNTMCLDTSRPPRSYRRRGGHKA